MLTTYGHLMAESEERTRRAGDAGWSSARATSGVPASPLYRLTCGDAPLAAHPYYF